MRKLTQVESAQTILPQSQQIVGKSYKHESADKQVSGEALFVDDYATPTGCLHAAVITSSIAKGSITQLDLSNVESAEGVVQVLTEASIPGEKDIGTILKGDPLLALDNEIKYFGQPIALILATTHELAWKAATLAKVEYNESDDLTLTYPKASSQDPLLPPCLKNLPPPRSCPPCLKNLPPPRSCPPCLKNIPPPRSCPPCLKNIPPPRYYTRIHEDIRRLQEANRPTHGRS